MPTPNIDIDSLSVDQRLDLIERLWDSLSALRNVPITEAQRVELDRRLDEMDRDGGEGLPMEEVLDRIRMKR